MDEVAAIIDRYPGLSRSSAALLVVLMRGRGRTLSYDHIAVAYAALLRVDEPDIWILQQSKMKWLRKHLRGTGLVITTEYLLGYRLEIDQTLGTKDAPMFDIKSLQADIAHGGPTPRILSVVEENGVTYLRIVLAGQSHPDVHADQITYHNPALNNPKVAAFARRLLRLEKLEQAVIAAAGPKID